MRDDALASQRNPTERALGEQAHAPGLVGPGELAGQRLGREGGALVEHRVVELALVVGVKLREIVRVQLVVVLGRPLFALIDRAVTEQVGHVVVVVVVGRARALQVGAEREDGQLGAKRLVWRQLRLRFLFERQAIGGELGQVELKAVFAEACEGVVERIGGVDLVVLDGRRGLVGLAVGLLRGRQLRQRLFVFDSRPAHVTRVRRQLTPLAR